MGEMENQTGAIPNLRVENIGSKTKPLLMVKGFITLPVWNGYFLFDDSYKLKKQKVVTNGLIDLWVDAGISDEKTPVLMEEQKAAYFFLTEHQESIRQSIVQHLKEEFPTLLEEEYGSWDHQSPDFPQPSLFTNEFDFKNYIGPESISIGEEVKDGVAYVTWRFRCRWDVEHGFDVVTHNTRVIAIAPEADPWKINKDNGTFDPELEKFKELPLQPRPVVNRKWWQFWQ